eukprot:TRINITY_DN9201_c0_g3_i1.p1 TRINITY_DN9201_c0_g3~~TRINITY_DN9201_c0_g3_i1.p1  ORF type:complete len:823 (+),score=64.60 TRINITY_DN9201_c0_g3_i1:50-2518(+)
MRLFTNSGVRSVLLILQLALSARLTSVRSIRATRKTVRAVNSSSLQVGVASAGQILRGRYRLQRYVETHVRAEHSTSATPGKSFPKINPDRRNLHGATHAGQGSFGDVWEAFDVDLNVSVAVKIFYRGNKYVTWKNAGAEDKRELKKNAAECDLVKQIMTYRDNFPLGASRICECKQEHITDAKRTDEVVFLVLESCGQNLLDAVVKQRRASKRINLPRARHITKQILEGLAFLQGFIHPVIHHDLKLNNVCINEKGEVKIIDWGGTLFGTPENLRKSSVWTKGYEPPELHIQRGMSFQLPYWSYDVYAVGVMYMELLCPFVEPRVWYGKQILDTMAVARLFEVFCSPYFADFGNSVAADVNLIGALTNANYQMRPHPMTSLDHPALRDVVTPTPPVALVYAVGDEVMFWSESYQEWMPAVVGAVDTTQGYYDLLNPMTNSYLRRQADPNRVRKRDFRSTIDEAKFLGAVDGREKDVESQETPEEKNLFQRFVKAAKRYLNEISAPDKPKDAAAHSPPQELSSPPYQDEHREKVADVRGKAANANPSPLQNAPQERYPGANLHATPPQRADNMLQSPDPAPAIQGRQHQANAPPAPIQNVPPLEPNVPPKQRQHASPLVERHQPRPLRNAPQARHPAANPQPHQGQYAAPPQRVDKMLQSPDPPPNHLPYATPPVARQPVAYQPPSPPAQNTLRDSVPYHRGLVLSMPQIIAVADPNSKSKSGVFVRVQLSCSASIRCYEQKIAMYCTSREQPDYDVVQYMALRDANTHNAWAEMAVAYSDPRYGARCEIEAHASVVELPSPRTCRSNTIKFLLSKSDEFQA